EPNRCLQSGGDRGGGDIDWAWTAGRVLRHRDDGRLGIRNRGCFLLPASPARFLVARVDEDRGGDRNASWRIVVPYPNRVLDDARQEDADLGSSAARSISHGAASDLGRSVVVDYHVPGFPRDRQDHSGRREPQDATVACPGGVWAFARL